MPLAPGQLGTHTDTHINTLDIEANMGHPLKGMAGSSSRVPEQGSLGAGVKEAGFKGMAGENLSQSTRTGRTARSTHTIRDTACTHSDHYT